MPQDVKARARLVAQIGARPHERLAPAPRGETPDRNVVLREEALRRAAANSASSLAPTWSTICSMTGMRWTLVLVTLVVAARDVEANSCNAYYPRVVTPEVPLGCPLVVYANQALAWMPELQRERMGVREHLAPASITNETETLDVWIESIDEDCVEWFGFVEHPYDRVTMELADVEVGDLIWVLPAYAQANIVEPGPCPTGEPPDNLYCQDPIQDYWACGDSDVDDWDPDDGREDTDGGGCTAGGGGLGLAVALLVVGVRRRRISR